jgi:hypothetical protein
MSVQKLERVAKARKDQGKCTRCGDALPVGSPYQYWYPGFRSNYKIVRCMKPECTPAPSERETSKFASVMAAQEQFDVSLMDNKDDIEAAVQEFSSTVQELADEYEEALSAWENGNEQLEEKRDHYQEQADELANWTFEGDEEPEKEEDEDDDKFGERWAEWIDQVRGEAEEAVQNVEQI